MDKNSLLKFIAKAHKNTYAAPKEIKSKYKSEPPILPGHKDYRFVEGDWAYHDSYTGSSWAPGREVVFFKDKPVWVMAYQGKIIGDFSEDFFEEAFKFLKKALRECPDEIPFRGPTIFKDGDYEYTFSFKGDYQYFVGKETIKYKNQEIFFQDVMGEIIK